MRHRRELALSSCLAFVAACLSPETEVFPEALRDMPTVIAVDADGRRGVVFAEPGRGHLGTTFGEAVFLIGLPHAHTELQIPIAALPVPGASRVLPADPDRVVLVRDAGGWKEAAALLPELDVMLEPFDVGACLELDACLDSDHLAELCTPCPAPSLVDAPEPPRLPCPELWVPDRELAERGFDACEWPVPERCSAGEQPFSRGCARVIPPCSGAGPWPAGLPASGVIYLSASLALGPDGLVPARTFEEAVTRARTVDPAVIAIASGTYFPPDVIEPFTTDLTLAGACADDVHIVLAPGVGNLTTHAPSFELRDLSLEGGLRVDGGRARILRARLGTGATVGLQIDAGALEVQDVALSGSEVGVYVLPGSSAQLAHVSIRDHDATAISAIGATLELRDVLLSGAQHGLVISGGAAFDVEGAVIEDVQEGIKVHASEGTIEEVMLRAGRSSRVVGGILIASSTVTIRRSVVKGTSGPGLWIVNEMETRRALVEVEDLRIEHVGPGPEMFGATTIGIVQNEDPRTEDLLRFGLRVRRYTAVGLDSALRLYAVGAVSLSDVLAVSESATTLIDLNGNGLLELDRIHATMASGETAILMLREADRARPITAHDLYARGAEIGIELGTRGELTGARWSIADATSIALRLENAGGESVLGVVGVEDLAITGSAPIGLYVRRATDTFTRFSIDGPNVGLDLDALSGVELGTMSIRDGQIRAVGAGVVARTSVANELVRVLDRVAVQANTRLLVQP